MGIYIIGGAPMYIGSSSSDGPLRNNLKRRNNERNKIKRRNINMSWLLRKKETKVQTFEKITSAHPLNGTVMREIKETTYEVGYMEEVKTFVSGVGETLKFEFNPVYSLETIEEAELKVHFLNGGS